MDEEYSHLTIESKWQSKWDEAGVFVASHESEKPKFYCLEMYPYPSGYMHMGHVRNYSIGDAVARFRRADGYEVLYPMGFDSFGMPAENAAIDEGGHPHDITERNIRGIKADFSLMGFSHDWGRELKSHDPNYYHWNQYFFLKFLENDLAYRAFGTVNWCEECQTVLAKEQVHNDTCWRCHSEVIQRDMDQWYLRITNYNQELWDCLEDIDYPDNVKALQRDWIGRSEGATIKFAVEGEEGLDIEVFTTRPDTLFGVTFVTLAPSNELCEILTTGTDYEQEWRDLNDEVSGLSDKEIGMLKEKKGAFLGRYAINPLSGERVPIYAGNFVIASYGTGSVMAVPGHDQRDFEFADKYGIEIKRVLIENKGDDVDAPMERAFEGYGTMVNSARDGFDGLTGEDAKRAVIDTLEEEGRGSSTVQFKIRDWLISRQRYWGTPIPIIHCEECGAVPVPEADLPVVLPNDVEFTVEGNPLESSESFLATDCPSCGAAAKRETDTMDTFVDSSWYFLRYTDPTNTSNCFDSKVCNHWMNVDFYCGGIEHAQMHLIYSRFWTKALRDFGLQEVDEPFQLLLCQGMVNKAAPFCQECNLTYNVSESGKPCKNCGGELGERSAKMSKSIGNTVSPTDMVAKYGADTMRLFMLFAARPTAGMDWSDIGVEANRRQLNTLWATIREMISWKEVPSTIDAWLEASFEGRRRQWRTAMEAAELRDAVMISHYEIYSDLVWYQRRGGCNGALARRLLTEWIKMIHPATPHFAEEIWATLGNQGMVAQAHLSPITEESEEERLAIAREIYVQRVIDQARQMRDLAERHIDGELTSITIQCAEEWKGELCRIGMELQEEGYQMKQALKVIMTREFAHDPEIRKMIPPAWKRVMKQLYKWSPEERSVLKASLDETAIIEEASTFIKEELRVSSLSVYVAGEGEDIGGKARFAFPSEPGIAYL